MVTPIITPEGLSGVTQIFSNSYAFAALKSDGTVVSWGSPIYGGTTPAGLNGVVGFANPVTNDRLLLATTTAAVTAVTDNVGIIQGTVASGATTDDTSLAISGTLSAAVAAGESVRIYDGTTLLGNASVIGTTWSYADTRLLGNNQSVSYTARVVNVAGNQSASGKAYTATFDQVAPTTTATIIAMADNVGLIKGNVADGASTDDTTPTFSGTLSAPLAKGETLRLFNGSTLLGSATVNNTSKTWSFTPKALPTTTGTSYAITTRVADAAGNLGDASASRGFFLDTSAPATTAAITNITDDVSHLGTLTADALTDDPTPTISGTLSAALASGDSLHVYNGTTFLGSASVTNTTWSFTPSALANGFYAVTARVADAAGNLGAASMRQRFSLDATANQVIGDANNNILNASSAKDVLTGYVGADTFSFTTPSTSTLASFDRITDFNIGTDRLDGPTAVTAANINKLGAVSGLNATSIGNLLTSASFLADRAATFTYADPSGISRRFIALNDGYAGFDASSDGIVEITGYTGLIANLAVI